MAASLGTIIRERRRRLGLTLEEVGRLATISKPYLSLIETLRVQNPPSFSMLTRLEVTLRWPPGFLTRLAAIQRTPPEVLALIPGETIRLFLGEGDLRPAEPPAKMECFV